MNTGPLRLLAGKVVELGLAPSLSLHFETVRPALKKKRPPRWQKQEWCIPKVSADFVAHMEDVLDLYAPSPMTQSGRWSALPHETSTQLLAETQPALPADRTG